jgi:glycosyltransferase involved in cell wall biosynthesis
LFGTDHDPTTEQTSGSARGLGRQIREQLATAPPDLIHLHELFRPPHLVLRGVLRSTPHVISTHGATAAANLERYRLRKDLYARLVDRPTAARADALVALTDAERDDLSRWLPSAPPIAVLANAADPVLLERPSWRPPRRPGARQTLVSLSRFDVRHKGLDRLAELAGGAGELRIRVHGSACGNEPRLLRELVQQAPPNLELAPPVPVGQRPAVLARADAFILLSRWEGLSMALLEAMALGMACFVSPEVATTIGDPDAVITVPGYRATTTVSDALADPRRLEAVGAHARRWVLDHAAPEVVAAASLALYDQVLSGKVTRHRALLAS